MVWFVVSMADNTVAGTWLYHSVYIIVGFYPYMYRRQDYGDFWKFYDRYQSYKQSKIKDEGKGV